MKQSKLQRICRSFFSLLFSLLLLAVVIACGNSGDTGVTPTPTPTPTDGSSLALTADVISLAAGNSTIVTATVKDGSGNPASGQAVTFTLLIDNSTATLSTISGTTDASGRAVAVYTAGSNNPDTSVQDTIQAAVTGAAEAIIITRTASSVVPPVGYQLTLTSDVTSLAAGNSAVVTATVRDGSGNPASGQAVTFTLLIDNSTATLSTISGTTDASGRAVAVYTAGSNNPNISVDDTIQAAVTGSTDAFIITRTASSVVPPVGYQLTLTSDVTSLAAGNSAVVTATVRDGSGNPASGQAVTFTLLIDNSTATLSTISGTTDASGRAVAVYTAGSNNPNISVDDTIQAAVTGSTDAFIITRTASSVVPGVGYQLTVAATPASLSANAISAIVATVRDNAGNVAAGVAVEFDLLIDNSGATLTTVNSTTDSDGNAVAVYTAGSDTPSLRLNDVVTASVTGSANAAIITRLPNAGTGNRILSFTQTPDTSLPDPTQPSWWSDVIMKVKVTTDDLTSPVEGETVTFSIILGAGTITDPDGAEGTPVDVLTDTNGEAYVIFTRPGTGSGDTVIRAQIPGTINGGDAASIVFWTDGL